MILIYNYDLFNYCYSIQKIDNLFNLWLFINIGQSYLKTWI